MSSTVPFRESVKLLLINDRQELFLMKADDPRTKSADGKSRGPYWFLAGGQREPGESFEETAIRELYEETGFLPQDVELGPVVWHGEFDLQLSGVLTHFKQHMMVVRTKKTELCFDHMTESEKEVIKEMRWFSLEDMNACSEPIFPVVMPDYLPPILEGDYPAESMEIDLAKQPD